MLNLIAQNDNEPQRPRPGGGDRHIPPQEVPGPDRTPQPVPEKAPGNAPGPVPETAPSRP